MTDNNSSSRNSPLYLSNDDVAKLVNMKDAIRSVRAVFEQQGRKLAEPISRQRIRVAETGFQIMGGGMSDPPVFGAKVYTTQADRTARFWFVLLSHSGDLLSIMEAERLGELRTGAASAVATDLLADVGATEMTIIGSGSQARSQVEGVCQVRSIERVRAWSPTRHHLDSFCRNVSTDFGIPAVPCDDAQDAARDAPIICTATTSSDPVLRGEWLSQHTHVNLVGSNNFGRREADAELFAVSRIVTTDHVPQAKVESGDLAAAVREGAISWDDVLEVGDLLASNVPGPERLAPSVFVSQGLGIWDLALAATVYDEAR